MRIVCNLKPASLYDAVHELIRMAYPGCEISRDSEAAADMRIHLDLDIKDHKALVQGRCNMGQHQEERQETYDLGPEPTLNQAKRHVRIFIFDWLCDLTGKGINNYGILTGMRPVKLVHRLLDQDFTSDQMVGILKEDYRLQEDKAQLLAEIACRNRPYLLDGDQAKRLISLYIGVPYCPTRCYYCSFPGAVLHSYETEIKPFFQSLLQEMHAMADYLHQAGLRVQTIYVGGGTPTVLSAPDLQRLFEALHQDYISSDTAEITVEAGRPDTLDREKFQVLQNSGVNRICINPQTMNDVTLSTIGRNHNAKGVVQAVQWAREAGIPKINMDLIVGLPGEGLKEYTYTAEQIMKIRPDNVTVHTLAVKRGSSMAEKEEKGANQDRVQLVAQGVDLFAAMLRQEGYRPYYLYRQKYMRASMENVGYALPDAMCLYNIQMIEERQTIIGLGGGAASKFIDVSAGVLQSFYNPKNPQAYCESLPRLIQRKVDKLRVLN